MTYPDFLDSHMDSNIGFNPTQFHYAVMADSIVFNVSRKWYDKYASGEKREEYREIKQHWLRRLFSYDGERLENVAKTFQWVIIRCGYSPRPETPDLIFKWASTEIGTAKEGIGRELMGDKPCYVIR